jgi:hypothetical protein
MGEFTFVAKNDQIPEITINGEHLALVKAICIYTWETATDRGIGMNEAIVSGYLGDSLELASFLLYFNTGTCLILKGAE